MPIGTVPPPAQHPDEEPLICVPINVEWIPVILGALQPLKYPEYWAGTLEENRGARKDFGILLDQIMEGLECMASTCCIPPYIINRVNVTTGMVEISIDNGETWQPQPGSIPTLLTEPIPPVTSGISETKCDAASNAMVHMQEWIDHVSADFDTAGSLLEFAAFVLDAILAAVLAVLSAGALTALQALILPAIGAACGAAFAAGKTVFDNYWDVDNKNIVLCAMFNNIGDDGAFTDEQFSGFWNECNVKLPASPVRILFVGFLSSIGRQGMNVMTAAGTEADSNCDSCVCPDPCPVDWTFFGVVDVVKINDCHYTMTTQASLGHFAFTSGSSADGCYFDCSAGFLVAFTQWSVGSGSPTNQDPRNHLTWNFDTGGWGDGTALDVRFSTTPFV